MSDNVTLWFLNNNYKYINFWFCLTFLCTKMSSKIWRMAWDSSWPRSSFRSCQEFWTNFYSMFSNDLLSFILCFNTTELLCTWCVQNKLTWSNLEWGYRLLFDGFCEMSKHLMLMLLPSGTSGSLWRRVVPFEYIRSSYRSEV